MQNRHISEFDPGFDSFIADNNIQASFFDQGATEDIIAPLVSGLTLSGNEYDPSEPDGVIANASLDFTDDASGFSLPATYTNKSTSSHMSSTLAGTRSLAVLLCLDQRSSFPGPIFNQW